MAINLVNAILENLLCVLYAMVVVQSKCAHMRAKKPNEWAKMKISVQFFLREMALAWNGLVLHRVSDVKMRFNRTNKSNC